MARTSSSLGGLADGDANLAEKCGDSPPATAAEPAAVVLYEDGGINAIASATFCLRSSNSCSF